MSKELYWDRRKKGLCVMCGREFGESNRYVMCGDCRLKQTRRKLRSELRKIIEAILIDGRPKDFKQIIGYYAKLYVSRKGNNVSGKKCRQFHKHLDVLLKHDLIGLDKNGRYFLRKK